MKTTKQANTGEAWPVYRRQAQRLTSDAGLKAFFFYKVWLKSVLNC